MLYIVDSSVVLKWYLDDQEENNSRALSIKDAYLAGECDIIVPRLLFYEVGNVLAQKKPKDAQRYIQALFDMGLSQYPEEESFFRKTVEISQQTGTTVYDASFHALAILTGGTLITADAKYYAQAKQLGNIELL